MAACIAAIMIVEVVLIFHELPVAAGADVNHDAAILVEYLSSFAGTLAREWFAPMVFARHDVGQCNFERPSDHGVDVPLVQVFQRSMFGIGRNHDLALQRAATAARTGLLNHSQSPFAVLFADGGTITVDNDRAGLVPILKAKMAHRMVREPFLILDSLPETMPS